MTKSSPVGERPLPDVRQLILTLRPVDLCRRLGFDRLERSESFNAWLVTSGTREYRALREDPAWQAELKGSAISTPGLTRLQELVYAARPDVQKVLPLPRATDAYLHWFFANAVAEHELWPYLTPQEKVAALTASCHYQSPGLVQLESWAAKDAGVSTKPGMNLPFGVNLIGHAFDQLGIGEDLRMTAHALEEARIPHAVIDFPVGASLAKGIAGVGEPSSSEGPYAINLFCLTALEHARFYAERGSSQISGRYNIGYWPWELSQWPEEWSFAFDLVDEIWVSTTHIRNSLLAANSPSYGKPVRVMPLVVDVPPDADRLRDPVVRGNTRKRFGLPAGARLFCFSFDLNSSIHRKNPRAVMEAFDRAFPHADYSPSQVGLVVKVLPPSGHHPAWENLKELASRDGRIHVVEEMLSREEVLSLYAACDCFVSLHRAEGFGRGLAEALQLGLHLIATDYSGNTDFCRRPEFAGQVTLIPYRLVKVRPVQYLCANGQVWASPDVRAAARSMREFVDHPQEVRRVPRGGWSCFRAADLGALYGKRMQEIFRELR